jgi:hypothetical protein
MSALILDVVVVMAEKEKDAAAVPKLDKTETVDKATSSTNAAAFTKTTTTAHRTITPQHIEQGSLPVNLKMAACNLPYVQAENVWYANVYNILNLHMWRNDSSRRRFESERSNLSVCGNYHG